MSLYSTILEKTLLPLVLRHENRHSSLRFLKQLDQSQFWSRDQLLDYQVRKLRELLAHAYQSCPYYRRIMDDGGLSPQSFKTVEDVSRLPVLTKNLVYEHMDEILSTRFRRSDLMRFSSGGTTGQQTTMFVDNDSIDIKMASAWRFESWFGMSPCDKLAILWPPAMDFEESPPFRTRFKKRYLWRKLELNLGASSEARLLEFYREVMSFGPRFIKAFPVPLMQLTEFLQSQSLPLPGIEAIESTGEPLYDELRRSLESAYGCPVYDMYGSREVGHTASQCGEREGLHIAMETSIVEFLNDGRPAGPGEQGELFVTDLTNYAFPLIRYEINDYGQRITEPCACGRGLERMSAGVGRLLDDFIGADGRRYSAHVLAVHTTGDFEHRIGQLQFIQRDLTDFLVRITNKPVPTEATYTFVENKLKAIIGNNIRVEFELVDRIPRERSGKTRFFICQVPVNRA